MRVKGRGVEDEGTSKRPRIRGVQGLGKKLRVKEAVWSEGRSDVEKVDLRVRKRGSG